MVLQHDKLWKPLFTLKLPLVCVVSRLIDALLAIVTVHAVCGFLLLNGFQLGLLSGLLSGCQLIVRPLSAGLVKFLVNIISLKTMQLLTGSSYTIYEPPLPCCVVWEFLVHLSYQITRTVTGSYMTASWAYTLLKAKMKLFFCLMVPESKGSDSAIDSCDS